MLTILLAASPTCGAAETAVSDAQSSRLWAYPKGVIVTSNGGTVFDEESATLSVAPSSPQQKKAPPPPPPSLPAELQEFAKILTGHLETCLSELRARVVDSQRGGKAGFGFAFSVNADGSVTAIGETLRIEAIDLASCVGTCRAELADHKFETPSDGKVHAAEIKFETILLKDSDAKGRGFTYYESQLGWEQALKGHGEWFRCKDASDCVLTTDKCETRGVNTTYLAAYREAAAARSKPGCNVGPSLATGKASCVQGQCKVNLP